MDVCLRELKESSKSRFDSYIVRNSVFIISHITFRDCRVHFFPNNLSRNSCMPKRGWGLTQTSCFFYLKILLMGKIAPHHGSVRNLHMVTTVQLFCNENQFQKLFFWSFPRKKDEVTNLKNSDLDLIWGIQPGWELFGFIVKFSISLKVAKSHFGIRNTDQDFP